MTKKTVSVVSILDAVIAAHPVENPHWETPCTHPAPEHRRETNYTCPRIDDAVNAALGRTYYYDELVVCCDGGLIVLTDASLSSWLWERYAPGYDVYPFKDIPHGFERQAARLTWLLFLREAVRDDDLRIQLA